jgi:ABC-2 type transport system ATP-binding protein
MTPVLRTEGLTKRYGRQPALTDATLTIPAGRIVGLVGPNGAGKTTLLNLTSGLIAPTAGTIEVLGVRPAANAAQLARVGFVAQDTPVYAGLSVADHLRLGARLNPNWDDELARRRIAQVGLNLAQKAGRLSGGQRAQLALTLAAAKRPELLIFDEPVASLDPLARRAFLQSLMEFVAELQVSVILSSHLLGDLERVCDHLIVLAAARVQLEGEVEDLLATHYRLVGARGDFDALPPGVEVVQGEHTARQSTLIVRDTTGSLSNLVPGSLSNLVPDAERLDLEDMILAYLTRAARASAGASINSYAEQPLEAQR